MNNPNPFVPKGSLLEQQNKRRTQMKVGVLCVLAVSVAGLMVMLIQGCKQKTPDENGLGETTNSVPGADTNNTPPMDTNNVPNTPTNGTVMSAPPVAPNPGTPGMSAGMPQTSQSPIVTQPPVVANPVPPVNPMGSETGNASYVVVKGDSFARIAKKYGVSVKALEEANPEVKPTRLKINQKLNIPAGGKSSADAGAGTGAAPVAEGEGRTYTVKSGDTLSKIAKAHHVSIKALEAANGLSTTRIKVGEKLKIPGKAEAPVAPVDTTVAPATVPGVPDNSMPAPAVPQVNPSAVPSTAPAPGH